MTPEENVSRILDTSFPKYKVGDKISSKQTGFPGIGTIFGVMPAISYCHFARQYEFKLWSQLYPEWSLEPIYMVAFDEPRRGLRFEEYLDAIPKEHQELYKEGALEILYQQNISEVYTVAYPEQDLESSSQVRDRPKNTIR